jgi:hypothetical protein
LKRIAALAAATAALLAPASALAKNFQQTGTVKGDQVAVVKLRVALNVQARCGKKDVRITLRAVTPIRVRDDDTFKARLADDEGGVLRLAGKVRKGGRKAKGRLSTNEFKSGSKKCQVPRQRWRTST